MEWLGLPMRSHEIEIDVYFNDHLTDRVSLGARDGIQNYVMSLTE